VKTVARLPGLTLYPGTARHWWESITPDQLVEIARRTDELGFDYVNVPTHFAMTREDAHEMGSRWVHSLSAAGFVLGATKRLKVVPLVCVPYHNAIELAKALSTLDYVSGGRVVMLALLGYKRWEYDLLGVPFEERGAIMNESLAAMQELWQSEEPRFEGTYVSFDDVVFDPKPHGETVEVWLGGQSKAAMRRLARFGTGWFASLNTRDEIVELLDSLESRPEWSERPRSLELSIPLFDGVRHPITHEVLEQPRISLEPDAILEQVAACAELGATLADVGDVLGIGKFQNDQPGAPPPTRSAEDYLERLQWFAEEVIPEGSRVEPAEIG
jgi:hypothetical protein